MAAGIWNGCAGTSPLGGALKSSLAAGGKTVERRLVAKINDALHSKSSDDFVTADLKLVTGR